MLPPTVDLPAGLTPGGFAGSYNGGDTYFVSDATDGSLWVGTYSSGRPAAQLPASAGVPGRRLYGIDFTAQVDVLWAAGGSANGSGVGYALDAATGATLATYVFAPATAASFVATVSGYGRSLAVFGDAGVPAVYAVGHGAGGWNPSFGPDGRIDTTFTRVAAPEAASAVAYFGFGLASPEEVEIVNAASGESYATSLAGGGGGVDQWQSRGLAGTARALTGAAGVLGTAGLGGTVIVARPSAGVLTVLRQPFDGTPTVVGNVSAAGVTGPVAIQYAGVGVYVLNRDPPPPPSPLPPAAGTGAGVATSVRQGGGRWDAYGVYGGGYSTTDCGGAGGGGGSAPPTAAPTAGPTVAPTAAPTSAPSAAATAVPSSAPTAAPKAAPTATAGVSPAPSGSPAGNVKWSLVAVPYAALEAAAPAF